MIFSQDTNLILLIQRSVDWASNSPMWASLIAQLVNHLPAMQETWVWFLGREDSLEKELATHSSILAWKIPLTVEPGRLLSMGSQRVRHDWATSLSFFLLSANEKPGTGLRAGTDTGWWDFVSFTEVFTVSWRDGWWHWSTVYTTTGIKTLHRRP